MHLLHLPVAASLATQYTDWHWCFLCDLEIGSHCQCPALSERMTQHIATLGREVTNDRVCHHPEKRCVSLSQHNEAKKKS